MTLYFAFDKEQYERLAIMGLPPGASIAVSGPGVALRARKDGCRVIDLWAFLSTEDIGDAYAQMCTVSSQWWRLLLGDVEHRGISLAEACHRDMWYAVSGLFLSERAVRRAIKDINPEKVVVCRPCEQAVFWDQIPVPPGCLPAAVAYGVAHDLGLHVQWVETDVPAAPAKPATPHLEVLERLEEQVVHVKGRDSMCLFLGEVEYLQHGASLETLCAQQNVFPLWLKASGNYALRDSSASSIVWYDLLSCFPGDAGLKSKLDRAWQAFLSSPPTGEYRALFSPHVRFQLKAFWDRLFLCGRIIDAASWLFERLNPKLCVQGLDAYGPARVWGRAARRFKARTVAFLHGAISPDFHQYERLMSEADLFVVEGDHARNAMVQLGRHPETLHVHHSGARRGEHASGKKDILIMTALSSYGFYNPMCSPGIMEQQWEELLLMMARNPDLRFVVKPHPRYDHHDFYEQLDLPDNATYLKDAPLSTAVQTTGLAVMMGYPSTVVLETLQAGIPTVFWRGTYPIRQLHSPLDDERIIKIAGIHELEDLVPKLLAQGKERDATIERGHVFARDFLGEHQGEPAELVRRIEAELRYNEAASH